jgi:hypothetical protein
MTVQTLPLGAVVVTANGNVVRCIAWVERDRRRAIVHASGGADHRSALVRRIDADRLEALAIAATLAGESDIAFWAGSRCIQSVRLAQPRSSPVGEKGGERH